MGNAQSTTIPREQNRLSKPRTNISKNSSSTQLSVVTAFGKTISNPQPCSSEVFEVSPNELSSIQQFYSDERGVYNDYQKQPQASGYRGSFKRDSLNSSMEYVPQPADFDPKLYSDIPYGPRTSTMPSLQRSKRLSSIFATSSRLSLATSERYPDTEHAGGKLDKWKGDVPVESEAISSKSECYRELLFSYGADEIQP